MTRSKKFTGVWLHHLKNKDISYYIQYKDEDGTNKRIKIGKKSEKITEQYCYNKRVEILNKIRLGEDDLLFKKKRMLFDDVFTQYIDDMILRGKKSKNINCVKVRYENHLKPYIGNKLLENISVEILNTIKRDRVGVISKVTVNTVLTLVSTVLNYAKKVLDIDVENNITNGKVTKYKVDNKRERFLSNEEIDLLLENTKFHTNVDRACRLSLSTGGRLSTVLLVKKKDIDISNRTVKLIDVKSGGESYVGYLHPKYFPDFDFLDDLKDNDLVVSDKGKSICYSRYQHIFKKVADPLFNLELDKDDRKNRVVFHTLRHTFCSLLATNNTPIVTIQRLVHHKDISSTLRYSKLTNESMFEQVEKAFQ